MSKLSVPSFKIKNFKIELFVFLYSVKLFSLLSLFVCERIMILENISYFYPWQFVFFLEKKFAACVHIRKPVCVCVCVCVLIIMSFNICLDPFHGPMCLDWFAGNIPPKILLSLSLSLSPVCLLTLKYENCKISLFFSLANFCNCQLRIYSENNIHYTYSHISLYICQCSSSSSHLWKILTI